MGTVIIINNNMDNKYSLCSSIAISILISSFGYFPEEIISQ